MRRFIFLMALSTAFIPTVADAQPELDVETVRTLIEEGEFDKARTLVEPALEADSKNHEAHYYLGFIELASGSTKEAVRHLERANELEDGEARYHFWLSQAYGRKMSESGKISGIRTAPKFRKQLERTLELEPDHIQALINLANYCLQAPGIVGGGTKKALEYAKVLVEHDERQGRLLLAQIHASEDRPAEAELEYKKLVAGFGEDEDFFYLYNSYGYFLLGQGRTGEAVTAFRKQVELAPDRANPYDSLGEGLRAAGKLEESLAAYRRALEIDPKLVSAKEAAAELEKELKRRSR